MYIWGRLAAHAATAGRRPRLDVPFGVSTLALRAWPGDCDPNGHVNNGRYGALGDLGRYDLLVRTGLWQALRRDGFLPVMGGAAMSFRREIRLWRRFDLVTRLVSWDGTRLVCEQRFRLPGEDGASETAVLLLTSTGFYDRKGGRFAPIDDTFGRLGIHAAPPEPDPLVRGFLAGQEALRRATGAA
jgi:acyl-CoA thioesterase FadM